MAENIPRFNAQEFYTVETAPSVIKEEIRTALSEYLGYVPTDSDPRMLEAAALMPYIVQTRALADAAAKSALLTYAQGKELDRIASSTCVYGYMDRLPARKAVLWVRLVLEVGTTGVAHYSGSFTAGGVDWSGEGDFVQSSLSVADGPYYVPFYASSDGTYANGISSIVDPDLSLKISDNVSVDYDGGTASADKADVYVNGSVVTEIPSCGGRDVESDDDFSLRIAEQEHAIRVPGSREYYNFIARQVSGISDVYTGESLDTSGNVQIWFSSPYVYAIETSLDAYLICYCGGQQTYNDLFYGDFRRALASAKPAGVGIAIAPAVRAEIDGFDTTVELTVYLGMTADEESALVSELYRRIIGTYNERMGVPISSEDISSIAVKLGAVAANTTFAFGTTDFIQMPPNIINKILPLSVSITNRISRETAPADTGGLGEEVL